MSLLRPDLAIAIAALCPNAAFLLRNQDDVSTLEWHSDNTDPRPSDEVILAKLSEMEAAFDAAEYQRLRAAAYPPVGDQLDALYHAGLFPPEMEAQIAAVKNEFPK